MKKNYCKPTMNVVKIQHQQTLLAGSVDSVNSGDNIVSPVFSGVTIDSDMHPYDTAEESI